MEAHEIKPTFEEDRILDFVAGDKLADHFRLGYLRDIAISTPDDSSKLARIANHVKKIIETKEPSYQEKEEIFAGFNVNKQELQASLHVRKGRIPKKGKKRREAENPHHDSLTILSHRNT